jgi:hypothetical protein
MDARRLNDVIDRVLQERGLTPGSLWVEEKPDGRLHICDYNASGPLTPDEATPDGIRRIAEEWADVVTWEPRPTL